MKSKKNANEFSLYFLLEDLLIHANGNPVTLETICEKLSGRGYGVLITLFSLPFCFPISVPGLSTPFGLLLAFLGLRVAFAKKPWWPKWMLNKEVPYDSLNMVITKALSVVQKLQKVLKPRLVVLATHPFFHRLHGLLIFALAALLSLPLPIPLTNMLTAVPIFCLGLGLLEDDGVAIIIAYVLALICFIAFAGIFYFGNMGVHKFLDS